MTCSTNVALVGSQRPTLLHLPEGHGGAGREAIDLGREVGIYLDEWQEFVVEGCLLERPDHRWAATETGCEVPRQNGKNVIEEVIELAGLVLFKERLVAHSAHLFPTATEHFLRMRQLCEDNRLLADLVDDIYTANGKEAIVLRGGGRLKFFARQRGGGRGFTGDRMVFDEAFSLDAGAVGAMIPALSARSMEIPGPQIHYFSSAAHANSPVLHSVRTRAQNGGARLAYFGWLNEPGTDKTDREAWYRVNPGLGVRISEEFVETELAAMTSEEFERERLGIPSAPDNSAGVFGPGVWPVLKDEGSQPDGPVIIALDVSPNFEFASFALAGTRSDGLTHAELVDRRAGTAWVVARAQALCERYGPLIVDPRGPVSGLLDDLKAAGVELVELADGDFPKACAALQKDVLDGTYRHLGQAPLDAAVAGAQIRPSGDAWRWSRSSSYVDISPLVAVTVAFWKAAKPRRGPARFHSFV